MAARHAGRATGKLTVLWAGASSAGRRGSSRALATGPRTVADTIAASTAAQRRPQQEALWCEPDPGRFRRVPPQPTRGRHEPVPPPAYCGARSEPCRAAGTLLPALLLATAADPGRGSSRHACPAGPQVAGTVFWRVPRGAILLPVMAGGAWRGNSAVYVGAFCGSEEEGCRTPFQGYAEAGYRAKQDMHKTALCIDRARSIHKLIPVPRPCRKFPSGILRRKDAAGLARKLKQPGSVTWLA